MKDGRLHVQSSSVGNFINCLSLQVAAAVQRVSLKLKLPLNHMAFNFQLGWWGENAILPNYDLKYSRINFPVNKWPEINNWDDQKWEELHLCGSSDQWDVTVPLIRWSGSHAQHYLSHIIFKLSPWSAFDVKCAGVKSPNLSPLVQCNSFLVNCIVLPICCLLPENLVQLESHPTSHFCLDEETDSILSNLKNQKSLAHKL